MNKKIRIANGQGFWGDSIDAPGDLINNNQMRAFFKMVSNAFPLETLNTNDHLFHIFALLQKPDQDHSTE